MDKTTIEKDDNTAHCLRCGRVLINIECIRTGYGVACFKRLINAPIEGQLSVEEVLDYAKA